MPKDAGAFANFGNQEPVASLDPHANFSGTPLLDPQAWQASGAPLAVESTTNANSNAALTGDFSNPWSPSFPPLFNQTAAGGNQGWIGGESVPELPAHTLLAGGRPMDTLALPQADTTTSHNHTALPALPLATVRRHRARQTRGVPCPECGEFMKRASDVRRHIAQKHEELNLHCPVDGCGKMFARQDKRREHLKRGHKLGERAIDAIYNALSDE